MLSLRQIANALGGEVVAGSVHAPGPGHSAADRSMCVTPRASAPLGLLVHSFAQDDDLACRDYVCSRLGFEPWKPNGDASKTKRSVKTTTTYEFRDPSTSEIRYRKTRRDFADGTKSFFFEKPARNGGPPLLYKGELLSEAIREGAPVFIVEGERKVDTLLEKFGAFAVCADTGSKSKWQPELARLLCDLPLILWPDSDEAGEKYIANAAAAIRAENPLADIRVVRPFEMSAKGEKGKDVCDWRGDDEAFRALMESAEPYEAPLPTAGNGHDGAPPEEPEGFYRPSGEALPKFEPLASRDELLVSAWRQRVLPPRDYLSGDVLCTTSRVLVIGETGIGKTLLCLDWAGAMASGADFLGWRGRRRARVMYLDGELPAETFKERIELIGDRYGDDVKVFGYNRDVLKADDMPPLNTEAGRAWLWREIEAAKPDVIFFDAVMCLLIGKMGEEDSWAPIKDLVRQISSRRIAQIWLHHTGHDASKSFGTKTREWEMDTVMMLSKIEAESGEPEMSAAFELKFTKARMRTPANFQQFATKTVRRAESGFVAEDVPAAGKDKPKADFAILRKAFLNAYERLADGVEKSHGFDGALVRKVKVDDIREELKDRGFLALNDRGQVTGASRLNLYRVKADLLDKKGFVEQAGLIWRTRTEFEGNVPL